MKRVLSVILLVLFAFAGAAAAEESFSIPRPEVGDIVVIGSYEQDNVLDNGKEPLEWIVLESHEDKAWLMTKYCIDQAIFWPERVSRHWGNSNLRAWMNGDFIAETFTEAEQSVILTTVVKNEDRNGRKEARQDTEDKIYLLSKEEVMHFMPECADRVAYPTEYAKTKGITLSEETGSCRWWTRTPGARPMDICGMRLDGRISAYGMQDVDWPTNTIRPVMWVRVGE